MTSTPPVKPKVSILISYHYAKNKNLSEIFDPFRDHVDFDLFADSGAFTAGNQGFHISPKDYAIWLTKWDGYFTAISNLDVVTSAAKSFDNWLILKDMGVHTLPVYHAGEDIKWLKKYAAQTDYIAIGGIAGTSLMSKGAQSRFVDAFRIAEETGCKYHAFGVTTWEILKRFPWYSFDSSTWMSAPVFGRIQVFDYKFGTMNQFTMQRRNRDFDRNKFLQLWHLLEPLGVDLTEFFEHSKTKDAHYYYAYLSSMAYWLMIKWMQKNYGEMIGPRGVGPKMYMVVASFPYVASAVEGFLNVEKRYQELLACAV